MILSVVASMLVAVVGWIANAATLAAKQTELESHLASLQSRYEREVVPRSEHDARNKAEDAELTRLQVQLDKMQITLDAIAAEVLRHRDPK